MFIIDSCFGILIIWLLKQYYRHGNHDSFDRMSLGYNIEKLRLIDSTLSSEKIKNYLLKHITKDFVLNTENQSSSNDMIDFYVQKSTSDDDKTYLKDLVIASNKLKPGNILPNAKLIDAKGNSVLLSAQIDSATVIYCWSTNFKMHSRNSHYKIKELKAKYPEVNFIAINFNDNDFLYWKKTLRSLNFSTKNEFKFAHPSNAIEKYVITYNHKTFVINDQMEIVQSNVGLFSEEMVECLDKLRSKPLLVK